MGSDTASLAEMCSLLNALRHEVNALKEENSALKKINKELEDHFEMTCSFMADQLNKNAKDKINDEEASAHGCRKFEAENNRKFVSL